MEGTGVYGMGLEIMGRDRQEWPGEEWSVRWRSDRPDGMGVDRSATDGNGLDWQERRGIKRLGSERSGEVRQEIND